MTKLLIVESPGKIKTLKSILGPEWRIEASVGHITELALSGPRRLGFDIADGKVTTDYVPRGDRGALVIEKLKKAAAGASEVWIATDPDREGEAIGWHIKEVLHLRNYKRISATEITLSAFKRAISNPGTLNMALVDSQRARQCLDKLVGFEVSPLLWNSTGGKSAGRVQTATLHLICEREKERLEFVPKDYWVLKSLYKEDLEATFEYPRNEKDPERNPSHVLSEVEAKRIEIAARAHPHVISFVEQKAEEQKPPQPLITSSLQQVAGSKFKFSPKHTMKLAQELYEGINGKGLITYMRTDSVALSPDFIAEVRQYLAENNKDLLPEKPPFYKTKEDAQGAHEAIRPTSIYMTPSKASAVLNAEQLKLYELIWQRSIASQCQPALLSKTKIQVKAGETLWLARGTQVLKLGYLTFWKNMDSDKPLPNLKEGQVLNLEDLKTTKRTTEPPARYSEPKLVQLMERKGIGRPSTYASTIATLKDRLYVGLEKNVLHPTELGMKTDEALVRAMPDLTNTEFTAEMEKSLDDIAEKKKSWEDYLSHWANDIFMPKLEEARKVLGVTRINFQGSGTGKSKGDYKPLSKEDLAKRNEKINKALLKAEKNDALPVCPHSHGPLMLKLSSKNKFYWKCRAPQCEEMAWYQDFSTEKCPDCGSKMEKVPSKKVTGGYFLKCKKNHDAEVVLFKNAKTKEWERARPR